MCRRQDCFLAAYSEQTIVGSRGIPIRPALGSEFAALD